MSTARSCALLTLAALASPAHSSLRITSEAGAQAPVSISSGHQADSLSHGAAVTYAVCKETAPTPCSVASAADASPAGASAPSLGVTYVNLQYSSPVTGILSTQGGVPYFNQYNYYTYTYPGGGNGFLVYVAMISGDVDMYVGDATTPVPTRTQYNFSSVSTYAEVVQVPGTLCPTACTYYIGVTLHANVNSSYSIYVVNASATVTLTDGTPYIGGVLPNAYNYYLAPLSCASSLSALSVALSSNFGLAYTYIIVNTANAIPSNSNYDYAVYGSGVVSLSCSDSYIMQQCPVGSPNGCTLSIAVLGVVRAAYYITASSDSSIKQLYNGVPTSAYLGGGSSENFAFNITSYSNITVALTALAGDPDIFLSFTNPYPSAGNCAWFAIGQGDEVVSITTADAGYANVTVPATLYITVYAWASPTRPSR